jgi:hypothetical protein
MALMKKRVLVIQKQRTAEPVAWFRRSVVGLLLIGCVATGTPKVKLLEDAGTYVFELMAQNRLPGFNSTEHGKLIASAPWKGGEVPYPASVIVRVWKQGDDSIYDYALRKDTQEAPWRLAEATRWDRNDNVIEHLFPAP